MCSIHLLISRLVGVFLFFFFLRRQNNKSSRSGRKKSRHFAQSSSKTRLYCLFTSLLLLLLHCSLTRRTPHRKREKKTPCIPAPKKAHDRCSEKPRRLRRDVGVRQDRGERRGSVRDPHLGILTEDAIDRRRLCTHGQDAPPTARVRQLLRGTASLPKKPKI